MMNKINIKSGLLIVLTLLTFSCEDLLTVEPENDYSVASSYQTDEDFEYAVAAVYASQQSLLTVYTNQWLNYQMSQRSDDIQSQANYSDGIDTFQERDDDSGLNRSWGIFWKMISRCNILLIKIEDIEFKDPEMKDWIKGEAYALRAWSYYTLGVMFGGMPLITTQLTASEIQTIPRSTMTETFAQAESDYTTAISLLPTSWSASNAGRVTRYAAMGGLARLHMFQSNFSAAQPLLKGIIDSGLYDLEPNYMDCFTDSNDNGIERVWEIQYHGGEGHKGGSQYIPEGNDYLPTHILGTSNGVQFPSQSLLEAYEPGDLRKDISVTDSISFGGTLQPATYYITKFSHFDTYTPTGRDDWANNMPILRYADVLLMYAECLNEAGYVADGPAFDHLNSIRFRAGLPDLTSAEVANQQAFRDAIIQERRIELAFEGVRWPDLIRWGVAQEVMNTFFQRPEEGGGIFSMKAHQTIYPVPASEINAYNNPDVFWQNPKN